MTTTHVEREAKLRAGGDFSLARLAPDLEGYVAAPAEFHRLHTIYYDSEDRRLARWGCSLRYRVGDGWTLKLLQLNGKDAGVLERKEHTFEGEPDRIPPAALDLAFAYLRGAPVTKVAELRTLRTKRAIRESADGDVVADVVDDDVHVVKAGGVAQRFRQLEIETRDGNLETVSELHSVLQCAGAGRIDRRAKNQLVVPGGTDPELSSRPVRKSSSGVEIFAAAFSAAAVQLVRSDAAIRSDADAEILHQLRTAVRRLRSHLRTFRPLLDRRWAERLRDKLGWTNRLMAKARNLDVLIASLERLARELEPSDAARSASLFEELRRERERAYDTVCAGLREPRYANLLNDVIAAARAPITRGTAKHDARKRRDAVVRKASKRLRRAVRESGTPPAERDLHAVRIKAKHVRFAAEAMRAAGKKPMAKIARRAKKLQTVLGKHHDAVVALRHLRQVAENGEPAFVAGQLAERSRGVAEEQRSRWRRTLKKLTALCPG